MPTLGSSVAKWSYGRGRAKNDSINSDGRDVMVLENMEHGTGRPGNRPGARPGSVVCQRVSGAGLGGGPWGPVRHSPKRLHGDTSQCPTTCREGHRGQVHCKSSGIQRQETRTPGSTNWFQGCGM